MKPLTFGAYLKLCALNSQSPNRKTTTNRLVGLKGQLSSSRLSLFTKLPSILLFLLLLVSCADINTAQTQLLSPFARAASAENASPAPVKEAQPHPGSERFPGHAAGGGFSLKRAALGILRFGKGLLTALGFGEGKNSSIRSESPGLVQPRVTLNLLSQMPLIDNSPPRQTEDMIEVVRDDLRVRFRLRNNSKQNAYCLSSLYEKGPTGFVLSRESGEIAWSATSPARGREGSLTGGGYEWQSLAPGQSVEFEFTDLSTRAGEHAVSVFVNTKPTHVGRQEIISAPYRPTELSQLAKMTVKSSKELKPVTGDKSLAAQTVYLDVERRDTEKAWLRMHNNSGWPVAVRTFTTYFNRKRAIDLGNGTSVFALPDDEEIGSLHYYVEKEATASSAVKAPELFHGDSYAISWVPANGSILFAVPFRQIEPDLMIYVPFQYSSELNEQLIFNKEPEHRVYFRGADLTGWQARWDGSKESSGDASLYDVFFINKDRGWILGAQNGHCLVFGTTDGGLTWQERFRSPDALSRIKFANEKVGWIVGGNGTILRTFDGGGIWTRQRSGTPVKLAGLAVIDEFNAWVTGGDGTLLYTIDGGDNWEKRNINSRVGLSDITFIDSVHGWAVGYGTILSTADGGKTWGLKSSGAWKPLSSVFFADHSRGWIAVGPVILRTTNGGETWDEVVPPFQGQAAGLSFVDSQYGWLARSRGQEGSVATIPGLDKLSSESFILSTRDSGTTWQKAYHLESKDHSAWVLDMFFLNRTRGWAVGRDGLVLRTVNSGKTWEKMQPALSIAALKRLN